MSYHGNNWRRNRGPTKVSFTWNQLVGIYDLKFHDTNNWDDIQAVISFLKTIPYGERDYDSVTKVWGIKEPYFAQIKMLLEHVRNFEVTIVEKPENVNTGGFLGLDSTPIDKYIKTYEEVTGVKLSDYDDAKKSYRRACLRLHPDRNPDNETVAEQMSRLNEAWSQLEVRYFKMKEFAQQEA